MRRLLAFALFILASLIAVRGLVEVHMFFADVPIEPLLGEGGVSLFLYFYFSASALCGALSLTLKGISARRLVILAAVNLAAFVVAVELYVQLVERYISSETLLVIGAMVANAVLIIIFFRNGLRAADASVHDAKRSRASELGPDAA